MRLRCDSVSPLSPDCRHGRRRDGRPRAAADARRPAARPGVLDSAGTAQDRTVVVFQGEHREERALREVSLAVQGMGCRRCVREVTARLRDVPGVTTVAADMSTQTVHLAGSMTDADVLAALAGTTYAARIQ